MFPTTPTLSLRLTRIRLPMPSMCCTFSHEWFTNQPITYTRKCKKTCTSETVQSSLKVPSQGNSHGSPALWQFHFSLFVYKEPSNISKVFTCDEVIRATQEEMDATTKNRTRELTAHPAGRRTVGCR